ncbi:MAG: efflux RND transporter periplasmic adaptor subunit [Paludibacteraceae bacterium]|nr:efflux RND transporter periplasmic adaptor subunit [Paludibacteraceae bacterium]MBR4704806.1 efflux RND transporter periplasmic adaptor subunit [Paludibacteraceae bacterium]
MKKEKEGSLLLGIVALLAVVIIVALVGVLALKPDPILLQGEAEAAEYRVSGKVPGRIEMYLVEEGDQVKKGDTLVVIYSPEVEAKKAQAVAARDMAEAVNQKAKHGAQKEQIQGAYELYQKAMAGEEIYRKSYERVQRLFEKGVVSEQKRDEVEAQYKAASATVKAAKSQYDMALAGARIEDKEAAQAQVRRVDGILQEVAAAEAEKYLLSPCNGEVSELFPKVGELVGQGSPVMAITDLTDVWFTFAVREDMLERFSQGSQVQIRIPALGKDKTFPVVVTHIKAMGTYATWRTTKQNGGYDVRTFDVKCRPLVTIDGLRPGMTAIIMDE